MSESVSLLDLIEQCREKQRDWHGMRGEDSQMSLLTGEEIRATVDSVPSSEFHEEERNPAMRPKMLPPIVNSDPGDETDAEVSWTGHDDDSGRRYR